MNCPAPEQLAELALGIAGSERLTAHVETCEACRSTLRSMERRRIELATAHATLNERHTAGRTQLLASLSNLDSPIQTASNWKRFAFGGLGLSTAAALVLLAFFAATSPQLSAMERMLTAVREVTSYSFKSQNTTTYLKPDGKTQRIRREIGFTCWRAPDSAHRQWNGDLHAETKSWNRPSAYGEPNNPVEERLSLHLVETYPSGKPGIIILYSAGFYFWVPPIRADYMPLDNNIAKLRAVRAGQGKILRDLGSKRIDGRDARGYLLSFADAVPFQGFGPVEVWVDPETDLPIELSFQWIKEPDKYIDEYRITDCRWNIDFPADQFATIAPAGLVDSTPPTDDKDIAEIVASLRLYAELSGGHYPGVNPSRRRDPAQKTDPPNLFDSHRVHDQMLKLAGFTGPPQPDWSRDPKFQKIESVTPGLEWLSRILVDHSHSGYFGADVTPRDKDKVLLWWFAGLEDANGKYNPTGAYRVFFGDLRSEIVSAQKWEQLVPAAAAP